MNAGKMHSHVSSESGPAVLLVATEMGRNSWRMVMGPLGARRHRQVVVEAGHYLQVQTAVSQARQRWGLPSDTLIIFCYEAGREGFHPYRVLSEAGYRVWVVDSSSIEVNRRRRRAKSDAIDAFKLWGLMQRQQSGDQQALRIIRVPSPAQEDERQATRERQELCVERGRVRVRMQSLLFAQGVRDFPKRAAAIEQWLREHACELPKQLRARLERQFERLRLVDRQLQWVDQQQRQCYAAETAATPSARKAQQLCRLKGIAERGAGILATELFGWRTFHNRREVGSVVGLVPTPYDSGDIHREQGISKAGNKRVRRVIIELAWQWLRYQPHSALTHWFVQRFGHGKQQAPGDRGARASALGGAVALPRTPSRA